MNQTPQRPYWTGTSRELETIWTLSKRGQVARLVLYTNQLGWELRVDSGDLLLTQVCKSDREIEDVSAAWKAAMIEKGWSPVNRVTSHESRQPCHVSKRPSF